MINSTLNSEEHDMYESDDEENNHKAIKSGDIIQGRFVIQDMIGEGSFGQVFKVIDQKQQNQVLAIKVEDDGEDSSMLEREIKVLIEMRKKPGFPQIKFYGQERGFIYCIMGLLGRNLESLLRKCGGVFTLHSTLRLATQVPRIPQFNEILIRIETLHQTRFIHRDIKPDNFVLGLGNQVNVVHLIDFGLSKYYQNSKGEHIQPCKKSGLIGTARYASVNAHEEQEQSRRDDLESIGYILIYMATGTLPWMNLQIESKDLKYAKIHQLKKHIKTEVLCAKLPKCFIQYMNDVRGLTFKQAPNYKELRQYFQDELDKQLNINKGQFFYDWEKLPEYQQKKRNMTVHLMQTTLKEQDTHEGQFGSQSKLPPVEEFVNPVVQNKRPTPLQLENIKFDQIMEKKKQQMSPRKQQQLQQPNSPTKRNKKPVMINVIEVQPADQDDKIAKIPGMAGNTLLNIPAHSYLHFQESYPPSLATSKRINYDKRSEDIESEGTLPIWTLNQQSGILSHQQSRGIKKPATTVDFKRKSDKSHTQVQTLKNISRTFIQPTSMTVHGDDNDIDEGD